MEKPNLEHRSYDFEVTAGEEGIITGRPIVYESRANIGAFDEIITRGALNGTNLTDVRFLVNHDKSKIPLARSRRNNENSTMQLIPDENGLSIRVKLDIENNAEARALYSAVKRGDVTGMSFAFGVGKDEWENVRSAHPTRHIRSISSVVEVSAVTFPAYDATSINARDSLTALENARRTLESVREDDGLELARAKAKAQMEVRFNHNHDSKGRFSSGGGAVAPRGSRTNRPKPLSSMSSEELYEEEQSLKRKMDSTHDPDEKERINRQRRAVGAELAKKHKEKSSQNSGGLQKGDKDPKGERGGRYSGEDFGKNGEKVAMDFDGWREDVTITDNRVFGSALNGFHVVVKNGDGDEFEVLTKYLSKKKR